MKQKLLLALFALTVILSTAAQADPPILCPTWSCIPDGTGK